LNFDPHGSAWGINFQRTVRRTNEESIWTGYARNQGLLRMTNAGRVTGLTGISQGAGLDLKPHAVGAVASARAAASRPRLASATRASTSFTA